MTATPANNPAPAGLTRKDEKTLPSCRIVLWINSDLTQAFVDLEPGATGRFDPHDLTEALRAWNLQPLPDLTWRLEQALKKIGAGPQRLNQFHVAQGRLPVKGQDGRIEWAINFDERVAPRITGDDRVDFHRGQNIRNIRAQETILNLIDPEPGVPGATVYGEAIPSQPGKPFALRAGPNVLLIADQKSFVAQADGHVILLDDVLTIVTQFEVRENLDFSIGNLDFYGVVRVAKNVQDGFAIRAARGIWVGGIVESAQLESGGAIEIAGGIAGKGKATLRAQGPISVKYINNAVVEGEGDITVATEIMNSHVRCRGKVTLSNGRIIGGEVIARKGVLARQIGSPGGEETSIIVGVDYQAEQQLREIRAQLPNLQRRARVHAENAGPFLADPGRLKTLTPDRLSLIKQTIFELRDLRTQIKTLEEEQTRLLAHDETTEGKVSVIITRRLHAGATVQITTCRTQFNSDIDGPIQLTPNLENGTVKSVPWRG